MRARFGFSTRLEQRGHVNGKIYNAILNFEIFRMKDIRRADPLFEPFSEKIEREDGIVF